jgi:hypothetical protein
LVRTWKEAFKIQLRYYSVVFPEELRKIKKYSVRLVDEMAEIESEISLKQTRSIVA